MPDDGVLTSPDGARAPRDHAVVVGINRYRDVFPPLRGAVNDATLFARWLKDPQRGGLDPNNVRLICSSDGGDLKPVRDEIEGELLRFFQHRAETYQPVGRRLYLFFSGHGVTPPADKDDCGLLMANADSPGPLRAVPGLLMLDRLRWAQLFEEIVLIMDCCREVSGLVDAHLGIPDFSDPTAPDAAYLYAFAAKWAVTASERELPHPFDRSSAPLWHGVFTHAVLQGLEHATTSGGKITAASFKSFVRRCVIDLLPPTDTRRPIIQFDDERPIVFGEGTLTEVTVTLSDPALGFRILDGQGLDPLELSVTHVDAVTRRVALPFGLYVFQVGGAGPTPTEIVRVLGEPIHVRL